MRQEPEQAAREMAGFPTATISDALFRMGHKERTMAARIKPMDPQMRVFGPALPVHAYAGGTHACSLAIEAVEEGQVIVIDGGGYTEAVLWGEIFSHMAAVAGAAGAVIDGAVRDVEGVRELGFPLFAAAITPAAGTGDKLGEVGIPISCAGVVVSPGDFVYGDRLGVVVVPPGMAEEALEHCRGIAEKERQTLDELRAKLRERS
ncbi:MAG: RraA family protein [Armatimonadota bacterium]